MNAASIDLLSASAHKFHGPKGVGLLYVRKRNPRVRCEPLMDGGGQERGLRPGTLNVPGIVGFGAAAALCRQEAAAEQPRLRALRDRLEAGTPRRTRRRRERRPRAAPRPYDEPRASPASMPRR